MKHIVWSDGDALRLKPARAFILEDAPILLRLTEVMSRARAAFSSHTRSQHPCEQITFSLERPYFANHLSSFRVFFGQLLSSFWVAFCRVKFARSYKVTMKRNALKIRKGVTSRYEMSEKGDIKNLEARIARIEEILTDVAGGNLLARIPVDVRNPDRLTALETGINLILSDLEEETCKKLMLAEKLTTLRKGSAH